VPSLLLAALSFSIAIVVAPHAALFVGLLLFIATLVARYLVVRGRDA
jgi:hypothetical protein